MDTVFDQAVQLINQYPELRHFKGKQDSPLIEWAEKALNVVFPPSYRRFLLEYGDGSFGGQDFYGITNNNLEEAAVVRLTLWLRGCGLPSQLVWVHGVEFKDYLVTGKNPDDELSVITWDYGIPQADELDQMQIAAQSFGEFFLGQIKEAISWHTREPNSRRTRGNDADLDALFKTAFKDE
jgi:antitoxin YobK